MTGDWFGPAPRRAHDSQVLVNSNVVDRLRFIRERVGEPLCLYGDRAYPVSEVLLRAQKGRMTREMEEYAILMSHFRESVEWVSCGHS